MKTLPAIATPRHPGIHAHGLCRRGAAWMMVGAAVLAVTAVYAAGLQPSDLRCEFRQNPVGLDVVEPRLSWKLEAPPGARDQSQSAYQVLVAGTPDALAADRGDWWNSGQVASDQTIHVVYGGRPLSSRARLWWKVRVWDREGRPSAWSGYSAAAHAPSKNPDAFSPTGATARPAAWPA